MSYTKTAYSYKTLHSVEPFQIADHIVALTFDMNHVNQDLLNQWHEHIVPVTSSKVIWVLPLESWQKIRGRLHGWKIQKEITLDKLCFNFSSLKERIPQCSQKYEDLAVFAYVVFEWYPICNPLKTEALSWLNSVDPETIGPLREEQDYCCDESSDSDTEP